MIETEVKVRVDDLKVFRDRILKAGAELVRDRHQEKNTLYDYSSLALFQKKQALRVREVGKKTFLTFKGTPQKSRKFKVREEYEVEVRKASALRKVLKRLGLSPVFQYRKHRTVYRKGRLNLCLDETAVGNFCEFEGKKSDIVKFVRSLEIPKTALLKLDYIELIKAGK